MADVTEGTEGTETTTNGVSRAAFEDARAAFLAGEDLEKPAPKAGREVADDDSDLEDEDTDELENENEREVADEEDPDADLDEDDDQEETEDEDDEKPDADTAKRLSQVQRTEKRMREQLKKERAQMEAEVQRQVQDAEARLDAEVKKWQPRIEAAEKFEKLAARASTPSGAISVLRAFGLTEDSFEQVGQILYTIGQTKSSDPEVAKKAKLAAAQLMKQSEYDAEIADLKKWREDREKTEREREQQAEADRKVDAFIGKVAKTASDKTPLAKTLLKNDPEGAREELQIVTFKLAKELGGWPEPKAVMIALEKRQRAKLRKLGIDPKAKGAAAALAETTDSKTTTTTKKSDKKTGKPTEKSGGEELSARDAFIRGDKLTS